MKTTVIKNSNSWILPIRNSSISSEWVIHILAATVLITAVTLFYTYHYAIHHDLAGGVLTGKLAVALGATYDVYNIYFPPAERIWFSIAARIHTATNWRPDLVVIVMTCLAIMFSTEFAYLIRKKTVGATPVFLIVSIAAFAVLPIIFKNIFGMREHLVVLGLWPYFIYRISDPSGTKISLSWRIVLGIWMGWALLFKYLYAIVVLLVELVDASIQRRPSALFRAENIIAGIIVFLYLLTWLGLQPSNREAITTIKSAIGANLMDLQTNMINAVFYLCLPLILLITARSSKVSFRQMAIGLAIVTASIIVAAIQSRWYTHHLFPIFIANAMLFWIIGVKLPKLFKAGFCIFLVLSATQQFYKTAPYQTLVKALENSFQNKEISLENKRIALLTAHPSPFNQVIARQGGLRWVTVVNFPHVASELKELDVIENDGTLAPPIIFSERGRQLMQDQILKLWQDIPPDIIIMDHSKSWPLKHLTINWNHVFSKDQRFIKILDDFTLLYSHSGNELSYEYYARKK